MNEGSLPRGDLSNKKKKSAHRRARKKETKKDKKSVSQKREDRAQAKLAELADGLDKERIYAEGAKNSKGSEKQKEDTVSAKLAKKNELRPLPADPDAIKALVTSRSFKPPPSKESLTKRFILPGQE